MKIQTPLHRVYLLTVWQESSQVEVQPIWRFRLEDPRTGQNYCFTNAAALALALTRGIGGDDVSSMESDGC